MKKLLISALASLLLGLVFKFPHIPGASLLLIIGALLLFIYSVIFFFKNKKEKLVESLKNLSFSFLTIYLLFRIQFWYGGPVIFGFNFLFIIAFGISFTTLIYKFQESKEIKTSFMLFIIYMVFTIFISFTHADRIYYFVNLNEITGTEARNESYKAWDKYSWFLYGVDKQKEALEANKNAQKIIEEKLKNSQNTLMINDFEIIKKHGESIRDKNWNDYE
ncbi:MAG: hypothetical protein Q8907_10025 [Bacteroidota bacterium]|nr:hypothetical protein [Bacteroidota bacterium]MDP4274603.1 hypothetical protein [Bacteroidota bacterium]